MMIFIRARQVLNPLSTQIRFWFNPRSFFYAKIYITLYAGMSEFQNPIYGEKGKTKSIPYITVWDSEMGENGKSANCENAN